MFRNRIIPSAYIIIILFLVVLTCPGCATKAPPPKDTTPIFYPPPPELPKIQFLTYFTGAEDIEEEKSAFDTFVTGEKEPIRRLLKPYGVSMYDGKIYVCDTNLNVMVFDLKTHKYRQLEGAKGLGKLVQPLNISMDDQGVKYVADPVRGQVVAYDRNEFYLKAYGVPAEWKPVAAAPYGDKLYVVDSKNAEIKVFDKNSGKIVKVIGKKGDPKELFIIPTNITIDKNGNIYVMDVGHFAIMKYDRDGHFLGKTGEPGQEPGRFARPRGIAIDRSGLIYAVDAAFDNVQIFNQEGQLLLFFGGPGKNRGKMFLPSGIFLDYDNIEYFQKYIDPNFEVEHLIFVVNQFGPRLVNVYGYGKEKGKTYPSDAELLEKLKERMKTWQQEEGENAEDESAEEPAGEEPQNQPEELP